MRPVVFFNRTKWQSPGHPLTMRMIHPLALLLVTLFSTPGIQTTVADDKQPTPLQNRKQPRSGKAPAFVRLTRDKDKKLVALETAVVRYVPKTPTDAGVTVDLIGAIHVADSTYYDQLNKMFARYDAVLYELVAPSGTRIPKDTKVKARNAISGLQLSMKRMLELEFQLEKIDYSPKNFVHADFSPEEFSQSMKNRGESFSQMLFRMLGQSLATQSKNSNDANTALLFAFFAQNRALKLKQALAPQFEDLDGQLGVLGGPQGSTIITERNKRALEVLKREINAGKKNLAIFYGAGHLADMEHRLIKDFAMKRTQESWVAAWSLKPVKKRKARQP